MAMMLDDSPVQAVRRSFQGEIDMTDCKLVTWRGLSVDEVSKVFPDAVRLGEMAVEFESTGMAIWRYSDAVGNSAFAFDKGQGLTSHGSQILAAQTVEDLRAMGAQVG